MNFYYNDLIIKSIIPINKVPFKAVLIAFLLLYDVWIFYAFFDQRFLVTIYEVWIGFFLFFCLIIYLFFSIRLKTKSIFYGIIIFHVLYCVIFIAKTSFLIDGVRSFTLFDDAMISMRYAKNLTNGYGLVWNPGGVRVEGYSNFLWTLYMAFWHLFPISELKIALPIQISGMFFLTASLFLVRKIADYISGNNKYVLVGSVLLTAFYLPINFWGLRGMETSVLGCMVLLITWRLLNSLDKKKFDPLLFFFLGIGAMIRIDFAYLFIGLVLFLLKVDTKNRTKNFLFSVITFLLVVGGQSLFRWRYYGDIFPNTYHLKMTGIPIFIRLQKGIWEAARFANTISPILFILPFIYAFFNRKNMKILLLLYILILQLLYSIYVGSDAWEWWGHMANRYLVIVMPLYFILISLMLNYIVLKIKDFKLNKAVFNNRSSDFFFVTMIIFVIWQIHGGLRNYNLIVDDLIGFSGAHLEDNIRTAKAGIKLKDLTTDDATIAVASAGNIPYFSDRNSIDLLGKTDSYISHLPAKVHTYIKLYPGHNKYDYEYSIVRLEPDIVAQLWLDEEEIIPWMNKYYEKVNIEGMTMYFRKDSPNIILDHVSDTKLATWD